MLHKLVSKRSGAAAATKGDETVFDTRFATAGIRRQVPALLVREIGFPQSVRVEFDTITDYFVVIVYLAGCIGFPKREWQGVIKRYSALTDELRSRVPVRIFDMIVTPITEPRSRSSNDG